VLLRLGHEDDEVDEINTDACNPKTTAEQARAL